MDEPETVIALSAVDVTLCYFEPVILVQWKKDIWLMCIVSKHFEKVLSVLKNDMKVLLLVQTRL